SDRGELENLLRVVLMGPAHRELEAPCRRERILREEGRLIEIDALQNHILVVRQHLTTRVIADGRVVEQHAAGEERHVFSTGSPVPPLAEVVVLYRAADVLHRSIGLDRTEDLAIAKLIAPECRHAADDSAAERAADRSAER